MTAIVRLVATLLLAASGATAQASLIGDSITGELVETSIAPNAAVTTPFSSPAAVGAGTEFSGVWNYPNFGHVWNIEVDVGAASIVVTTHNSGINQSGIRTDFGTMFRIDLGDLDMGSDIIGVTQSGGPLDAMRFINFTAHEVSLGFKTIVQDGRYEFDLLIADAAAVPEPGSIVLFGLAFAGLAAVRRRAITASR
ncbi:MAG: PEP-CTERM sorting domain-containing protein [Pseudomonadota bacterium]